MSTLTTELLAENLPSILPSAETHAATRTTGLHDNMTKRWAGNYAVRICAVPTRHAVRQGHYLEEGLLQCNFVKLL